MRFYLMKRKNHGGERASAARLPVKDAGLWRDQGKPHQAREPQTDGR